MANQYMVSFEHQHKGVLWTIENNQWGLAGEISFWIISSESGWNNLGECVYWEDQIDGGLPHLWTWANSGRWWGTVRPVMLWSRWLQRVGHDWVTQQQQ